MLQDRSKRRIAILGSRHVPVVSIHLVEVVARSLALPGEKFIRGLDFVGGAAPMGGGYESTLLSGRTAAQMVLARLKKT